MSGGACAVIIGGRQAAVASDSIVDFAGAGLLTSEQKTRVTEATNAYLAEVNAVAAEIPDPVDDD